MDDLFAQLERLQGAARLPPVHQWHPQREGRIDIRIARDGTWYHEGSAIRRTPLVRLFSTVLRLDDDGYCLVTPAERLLIEVELAPFAAVDMDVRGSSGSQEVLFVTNVGDLVPLDDEHPLEVRDPTGNPQPLVMVRSGLNALLSRSVFYRLVDLAQVRSATLSVHSRGTWFDLGPAA